MLRIGGFTFEVHGNMLTIRCVQQWEAGVVQVRAELDAEQATELMRRLGVFDFDADVRFCGSVDLARHGKRTCHLKLYRSVGELVANASQYLTGEQVSELHDWLGIYYGERRDAGAS